MDKLIKVTTMLGLCFALACNSGVSPAEYNAYITNPDNGLVPEKQVDYLNFRCEYKPAAFMVLNEKSKLTTQEKTSSSNTELINEAQNFITFYLKISSGKNTDYQGSQYDTDHYERKLLTIHTTSKVLSSGHFTQLRLRKFFNPA